MSSAGHDASNEGGHAPDNGHSIDSENASGSVESIGEEASAADASGEEEDSSEEEDSGSGEGGSSDEGSRYNEDPAADKIHMILQSGSSEPDDGESNSDETSYADEPNENKLTEYHDEVMNQEEEDEDDLYYDDDDEEEEGDATDVADQAEKTPLVPKIQAVGNSWSARLPSSYSAPIPQLSVEKPGIKPVKGNEHINYDSVKDISLETYEKNG